MSGLSNSTTGAGNGTQLSTDSGPVRPREQFDQLGEIESELLSFGRALGGQPDTLTDLPFTEQANRSASISQLFVKHEPTLFDSIVDVLAGGDHVALCSEPGTGKTMLYRRLLDQLQDSERFVVTAAATTDRPTPRQLTETVLRAADTAGYGIDPAEYWQVDNGVPWRTTELEQAVTEVTMRANVNRTEVVLAVDEYESLSEDLQEHLETLADCGVTLLLFGRPSVSPAFDTLEEAVSQSVQRYDGIDRFDVMDIAAYTANSLAVFRDCDPTDANGLFSNEVLKSISEETKGNPRAVRQACLDAFARGALVWENLDVPAERITITPSLLDREFERLA